MLLAVVREFVQRVVPELEAENPFCPLIVDKFDPEVASQFPSESTDPTLHAHFCMRFVAGTLGAWKHPCVCVLWACVCCMCCPQTCLPPLYPLACLLAFFC